MSWRHQALMLLLAAIWGASFLFLKLSAPIIGPVAVAAGRVTIAALVLLPFAWKHLSRLVWQRHGAALFVSGIMSCVLPFMGLSFAARTVPAGLLSILNATTPLWGALVGWLWAKETLSKQRFVGLGLGFGGVAWLSWHQSQGAGSLDPIATLLALSSTLMYALAVHHSKKYLSQLTPIVVTTGCLLAASLTLSPFALALGPMPISHPEIRLWFDVSLTTWLALFALGIACTAWAYLLFFRLIGEIGPSRALTVTFLIPVFGMIWGALFLSEKIDFSMILCTAIIVGGTQLSNKKYGD